ncbi:unnamed protein product [Protopolystoma xenopodis]|uniref:Uncharacterized protein n=1 Tax=Protopolystoma xenopodis TaxID=117903 RepID=A0A448WHC4_9PLAT|nr:unnamed protein product [Protopolystoma xenopodis]
MFLNDAYLSSRPEDVLLQTVMLDARLKLAILQNCTICPTCGFTFAASAFVPAQYPHFSLTPLIPAGTTSSENILPVEPHHDALVHVAGQQAIILSAHAEGGQSLSDGSASDWADMQRQAYTYQRMMPHAYVPTRPPAGRSFSYIFSSQSAPLPRAYSCSSSSSSAQSIVGGLNGRPDRPSNGWLEGVGDEDEEEKKFLARGDRMGVQLRHVSERAVHVARLLGRPDWWSRCKRQSQSSAGRRVGSNPTGHATEPTCAFSLFHSRLLIQAIHCSRASELSLSLSLSLSLGQGSRRTSELATTSRHELTNTNSHKQICVLVCNQTFMPS